MAKITYLLGAGASIGALPIVSQMADQIREIKKWLSDSYKHYSIPNQFSTIQAKKFYDILEDLEWLAEKCDTSKNFSIDTFARKLDLSEKFNDYEKLKNILSFYFTIQQKINPPDVRYDNFWASILKSKLEFPDNIKIISWNYDFQLELTYQSFLGIDSLKTARKTLNLSSLESKSFKQDGKNGFGVYKLNGSATISSEQVGETNYWIDKFNGLDAKSFIQSIVELYEKILNNNIDIKNHLSFAWEHKKDSEFYKHLKESVSDTEVLVVIGYSFPFFNRDIDKLILSDFMGNTLYKVYFQAPDAEDLRERFLAINDLIDPNYLVLRRDVKQFTLPNEL